PCYCGRGTMRFKVLGRVQDALCWPPHRVLSEHDVSDFLYVYPGVEWFQLVQRAERQFDLQGVDNHGPSLSLESLSRDLTAFLGGGAQGSARRVPSIPPENGGKFRFTKAFQVDSILSLS